MSKFHIWPHQPRRDPNDELRYRTFPMKDRYIVSAVPNVIAQTALYRFTFEEEWPQMIGVADLHSYLFDDIYDRPVSKRHMGSTVIRAIAYEPRKLKGATKDNLVAQQTYCIERPEELRYGLEWMIYAWLPTFLSATVAREELPAPGVPDGYMEEMDDIVSWTHEEWIDRLVNPLLLGEVKLREPAWDRVEYPDNLILKPSAVSKPRVPPRDLSK